MATIDILFGDKTYTFSYSITKISDDKKKDRYWDFKVSHNHDNLDQVPKSFSFKHDTFHNVTQGKTGGPVGYVREQIIIKELP